MSWAALQAGAPELALEGRARFERTHVALLGTIRSDGTPRISPVEPYFIGTDLVLGVMPSPKLADLRRDPRCVLHSAVTSVAGSEGEFNLRGRALETRDATMVDAAGTWWAGRADDRFAIFVLAIDAAVLVTWSTDLGVLRTLRWTPRRGVERRERPYP